MYMFCLFRHRGHHVSYFSHHRFSSHGLFRQLVSISEIRQNNSPGRHSYTATLAGSSPDPNAFCGYLRIGCPLLATYADR